MVQKFRPQALWTVIAVFLVAAAGDIGVPLTLLSEKIAIEESASCLDGSPAGYYLRQQDPDRWLVYLEGGGLCIETVDCMYRAKSHLGSSKYWAKTIHADGPFTTSSASPFANWSQVFVPYCSGDMWLGTDRHGKSLIGGYQMSGHLIVNGILNSLLNTTSLKQASEVVLSGSSAGGVAVIQHVDWLAEKLRRARSDDTSPRLVGVPLAGIFFPTGYPVLFEEFSLGVTKPFEGIAASYCHALEGGFLQEDCVAGERNKAGGKISRCFDVMKVMPYVRTPLFIIENQFDMLQIQYLGLCLKQVCNFEAEPTSMAGRFIRFFGKLMNQTLLGLVNQRPEMGIFSPSFFRHDENLKGFFNGVPFSIQGISLAEAFHRWYALGERVSLIAGSCMNHGPCPEGGDEALLLRAHEEVSPRAPSAVVV
eukprot:gnl/TRDRNA2_/TRDRNA2_81977_c0_seq1.p1 gnl/TRDRNA2_/TRDRNA2_81977_c0~~gnl/TRDRNA2_/TRDRNA2_81977_c0_seq1.p1  ORF type:complete len:422 (-),score=60.78 gnl/TRDRNA2_/TRDRNA2_81977_c0_seq1:118-1383(-)